MTQNERNQLLNVINATQDLQAYLNITINTNAGPCADFVLNLIQQATDKCLVNACNIFNRQIDLTKMNVLILDSYNDLIENTEPGDILCILNSIGANHPIYNICHYVLYTGNEINGGRGTIGVNGFYAPGAVAYKNVVGFGLQPTHWINNHFIYNPPHANTHFICRIKYDLF